jgi:hypothetical protein
LGGLRRVQDKHGPDSLGADSAILGLAWSRQPTCKGRIFDRLGYLTLHFKALAFGCFTALIADEIHLTKTSYKGIAGLNL